MIISTTSSQREIGLKRHHNHRNSFTSDSLKSLSHNFNNHYHNSNPKSSMSLACIKNPTHVALKTDSPKSSNDLNLFHKESISMRQKRRSLRIVDSASDEETEPPVKKIASTSSPCLFEQNFSSNVFLDVVIPKKKESKFSTNVPYSVTQHNDTLQKRSLETITDEKLASSLTNLIPKKKSVRTIVQKECFSHNEKHIPILSQDKKLMTVLPVERQVLVETISSKTSLLEEPHEKRIQDQNDIKKKSPSLTPKDKEEVNKKSCDVAEKKKHSPIKQETTTASKFSRELCSLYEDLIDSGASQLLLQKSCKRHRDLKKPLDRQTSSHPTINSCSKITHDAANKGNYLSRVTSHVKKQLSTITKSFQLSKNPTLTLTKTNKVSVKATVAKAMDSTKGVKPRDTNGSKHKQLARRETTQLPLKHGALVPSTTGSSLLLNQKTKKKDSISSTLITPQRNKSCNNRSSSSTTCLKNCTAVKSVQTIDYDVPPTNESTFKRTKKHVVLIHSQFLIQRLFSHPIQTTPFLLPTKI
ncbi:uncharacterized protein LOC128883689 [Hylaeus volcanicus]|uniref:uncharacterized protein LOC128883689 n=1 Tax=Hylaeus volcanicus TaxID=313075 RepID=UPI0023B85267|nr:uncharacterized protein LOC128883689 [Hylaeus volcanicus]